MVYNDSKACIVRYLDFVNRESKEIKGLEQAVESYQKISQKYAKMAELSMSTQVKIERAIRSVAVSEGMSRPGNKGHEDNRRNTFLIKSIAYHLNCKTFVQYTNVLQ